MHPLCDLRCMLQKEKCEGDFKMEAVGGAKKDLGQWGRGGKGERGDEFS